MFVGFLKLDDLKYAFNNAIDKNKLFLSLMKSAMAISIIKGGKTFDILNKFLIIKTNNTNNLIEEWTLKNDLNDTDIEFIWRSNLIDVKDFSYEKYNILKERSFINLIEKYIEDKNNTNTETLEDIPVLVSNVITNSFINAKKKDKNSYHKEYFYKIQISNGIKSKSISYYDEIPEGYYKRKTR